LYGFRMSEAERISFSHSQGPIVTSVWCLLFRKKDPNIPQPNFVAETTCDA